MLVSARARSHSWQRGRGRCRPDGTATERRRERAPRRQRPAAGSDRSQLTAKLSVSRAGTAADPTARSARTFCSGWGRVREEHLPRACRRRIPRAICTCTPIQFGTAQATRRCRAVELRHSMRILRWRDQSFEVGACESTTERRYKGHAQAQHAWGERELAAGGADEAQLLQGSNRVGRWGVRGGRGCDLGEVSHAARR